MREKLKYKDYIEHYRIDAEDFDYFSCDYPSREAVEKYRAKLVSSCLKLGSDSLVLDVGSGGGLLAKEMVQAGAGVVGVDLSTKNLSKVRLQVGSENFHPVVGDVYRLPFRDFSFGAIFLSSLLEHLEAPEEALKQSTSLLKERGHLVVVVPYKEKIRYHLCIHCNRPTPGFAHLHSFDEEKLTDLLKGSGLRLVHLERFANRFLELIGAGGFLASLSFQLWRFVDKSLNLFLPRTEFLLAVGKASQKSESV